MTSLRWGWFFTIAADVRQIPAAVTAALTGDRQSALLQADEVAVGYIARRIDGAPLIGIDRRRMDDRSGDDGEHGCYDQSHDVPP